jgi:pre-mRNA-splicing factor ATP-dependent RNA helicase DHX15/PRP43
MAEPPQKRSKMAEAGPSTPLDNPYLSHRQSNTYASGANGVASNGNGVKNPLNGLVPRQVTVAQAKDIMVSHTLVHN